MRPWTQTQGFCQDRLDATGLSLARRHDTLALIGLGSVGRETDRLEAWSDRDFFAIVAAGRKAGLIDELGFLAAAHPVAWSVRNTADGHKALMAHGVLCEFAVFEPEELQRFPLAPGRVVCKRDGISNGIVLPHLHMSAAGLPDGARIVGGALS